MSTTRESWRRWAARLHSSPLSLIPRPCVLLCESLRPPFRQVITLQRYWRQWLARKFVEGLRRDKLRKMAWDKEEVRPTARLPLRFLLTSDF